MFSGLKDVTLSKRPRYHRIRSYYDMARIAGAIFVVQAGSMEISSPSNSRPFGCRAGGRYAGK